jgi:hypothetical protein
MANFLVGPRQFAAGHALRLTSNTVWWVFDKRSSTRRFDPAVIPTSFLRATVEVVA